MKRTHAQLMYFTDEMWQNLDAFKAFLNVLENEVFDGVNPSSMYTRDNQDFNVFIEAFQKLREKAPAVAALFENEPAVAIIDAADGQKPEFSEAQDFDENSIEAFRATFMD